MFIQGKNWKIKMYLQFGCGVIAPPGWENYDGSPTLKFEKIPIIGKIYSRNEIRFPDNVKWGDIVKGLPIKDGSCDGVYCSHVLEHLSFEDCKRAIQNTFCYLKKGGIFRLVVPDLEALAKWYVTNPEKDAGIRFISSIGMGFKERKKGLFSLLEGLIGNAHHLWMWDERGLRLILEQAGFSSIRRVEFNETDDPKFKEVDDKNRFEAGLGIEARK